MPTSEKSNKTGLIAGIIGGAVAIIAIVIVIIVIAVNSNSKPGDGDKGNNNANNSQTTTPEIEGTWTLSGMIENGKEFDKDYISQLGYSGTMTFNADGTGTSDISEDAEDRDFTYDKETKTITSNSGKNNYHFDGKKLVVEEDSIQMIFEK